MANRPEDHIQFMADFDGAALNVSETRVEGEIITLVPRRLNGEWKGDFAWIYFMMSGVKGVKPFFRLSVASAFAPFHDAQRFVFGNGADDAWSFFDYGRLHDFTYEFSHSAPFKMDTVHIAYGLPYPYARTIQHTAAIRNTPWVSPTDSADLNLLLGRTHGTEKGGYTDDMGRIVPPLDLKGYRITDMKSDKTKQKIVLTSGNHSGEHLANYVLEGLVDFLISDEPEAVKLRRKAIFYVYPQTNPEGRYAGYFRSNPENPHEDHNRHWKDPRGFTDIRIVRNAMLKDTGGTVDYFIDFHCQMKRLRIELYVLEAHAGCDLITALSGFEPDIFICKRPGSDTGIRTWSQSAEGLNARVSMTPEIAFLPGVLPPRYRRLGENYGLALAQILS